MKVRTNIHAPGPALRPDLSRGVRLPDPRPEHRDDIRAFLTDYMRPVRAERALSELEHGKLGRARADQRATRSLWRSLSWLVVLAVLVILVGLVVIAVGNQ